MIVTVFKMHFLKIVPLLLISIPFFALGSKGKIVLINPSKPLAEQIIIPETKYIIKDDIDLKGETISIPYLSEIVIKEGVLSNGTIKGDHSFITLKKDCLENINFGEGVECTLKSLKTSFFKTNFLNLLGSLCNICPNNGKVVLDADYVYFIDSSINIRNNIIIEGNNKTLKLRNPKNCAITAFKVENLRFFKLSRMTIDGSWNKGHSYGEYTNQDLIHIDGVDTVIIEKCIFKNAMIIIANWREKEAGIISIFNYKYTRFDSNKISNCFASEGLLVRNDDERKGIAYITNNIFDYIHTSSCVNAYYGRYLIKNNIFGTCRGSAINIFGYDSQILNNIFYGSQYSCAIDLSENGFNNYPSQDIVVSDNISYFCYDGFVAGHGLSNIKIHNNYYYGSIIKQGFLLDKYDEEYGAPKRKRITDRILSLSGNLKNIEIKNNYFNGGNALLFFDDDASRKKIIIEKNKIELLKTTTRSALVFNSIEGLVIKNNVFKCTGCTPGYLKKPVFFATLPVIKTNHNISNITIEKNQFYTDEDYCYIFAQSIYDRNMDINFLRINNISIRNNESNVQSSLIFVNDSFSFDLNNNISVRNNFFNNGVIFSNISIDTDMEEINKKKHDTIVSISCGQEYQINTVVEIDNKSYYVLAGGCTAGSCFVKKGSQDFIENGEVILHEMK